MDTLDQRAQALRAFTRFYSRRTGMLEERLPGSPCSLTESRLLWELAHAPGRNASALARELQLDAGYLSRLLAGLRERGLVRTHAAPRDARQSMLSLTGAGRRMLVPLERQAQSQSASLLGALPEAQQQELLHATQRIRSLLGEPGTQTTPQAATLRPLQPGDLGWVVARHGALYAREYGFDPRFEALVARIVADYVARLAPARETAWIAEHDGVPLGCVFLVRARDEAGGRVLRGVAQLRLLLVEPAARGLGLGRRLTDACEAYARQVGYRRILLWTNSVLVAARAIYASAGYRLLSSEAHRSFGRALVGEVWEKDLRA